MAVVCLLPASEYFITQFVLLCTFLFTEINFDSCKLLRFQVFACLYVCHTANRAFPLCYLSLVVCLASPPERHTVTHHLQNVTWQSERISVSQPRTHIFTLKMNTYNDREQQRVYAFTLLLEADYMNILLVYRS